MAWSYRKRIKIIPGVHLNFSKRGISTSIGVKGASINFSASGTTINTSIPGLGLSNRYKLPNSNRSPVNNNFNNSPSLSENTIFSADIHEITSQNMQGIKESIIMAHQQKKELQQDLQKIHRTLATTKIKKTLSYVFLYGLINKDIPNTLNIDIKAQQEAIHQTKIQIENSCVSLDIEFDTEIKRKFENMYESFKKLTSSHKIWDITSAHFQDRVAMRSSASTLVSKREVKFSLQSIPYLKSNFQAMYFKNANGADLYFYPTFIVMYTNENNFAIIGIDEINFHQSYVRFTETGTVPRDSKVIAKTWAKVNKNGTPDKRFKANYQIPIVRYGKIQLTTQTGVNEDYQFSNYELTEEFGRAFKEYQAEFRSKAY